MRPVRRLKAGTDAAVLVDRRVDDFVPAKVGLRGLAGKAAVEGLFVQSRGAHPSRLVEYRIGTLMGHSALA